MISEELLKQAIAESQTMLEAANKLGLSFTTFKRAAVKYNCYKPNQGSKGVKRGRGKHCIPVKDILAGKYPEYQTYKLKTVLINAGYLEDRCQICGWDKKPESAKYTPCELHHIDGNPHNHVFSNLQLLCPNCHSLTKTYRFRRDRKAK